MTQDATVTTANRKGDTDARTLGSSAKDSDRSPSLASSQPSLCGTGKRRLVPLANYFAYSIRESLEDGNPS